MLTLTFVGYDSWDRPVYKHGNTLYVDVSPLSYINPEICTKYNNEFDGEPDTSIKDGTEIQFVPDRVVWR